MDISSLAFQAALGIVPDAPDTSFPMSAFIKLPITPEMLKRLSAEAQAEGVALEEYAARRLEQGFGVPAAEVVATVLGDAAAAAEHAGQT